MYGGDAQDALSDAILRKTDGYALVAEAVARKTGYELVARKTGNELVEGHHHLSQRKQ
jgi:hypothetical protein